MISVESIGAPTLHSALKAKKVVTLENIDTFVDGAAIKTIGKINFNILKNNVHQSLIVPEGEICGWVLHYYNQEGIIVEPAGALATTGLEQMSKEIEGKNVVVIVSGGNNDVSRIDEIRRRFFLNTKLRHYFLIGFSPGASALKRFINDVLAPTDNIIHFEYHHKSFREENFFLLGIETKNKEDFDILIKNMIISNFEYIYLNNNKEIMKMFV